MLGVGSVVNVFDRAWDRSYPLDKIEAIKWLGLAAMLIAHFFDYVADYHSGFLYGVGALALPLFALALGLGLAGKPRSTWPVMLRRMFLFAILAQVTSLFVRDGSMFNVIFTIWVGVYGYWFFRAEDLEWFHFVMALAAIVVGINSEFSLVGAAFVFVVLGWVHGRSANWLVAGLILLALLAPYNGGNPAALLLLPVVWLVGLLSRDVPRVRGAFYWFYVGQFPVFWVVRSLI